jgi:hypothetical protein
MRPRLRNAAEGGCTTVQDAHATKNSMLRLWWHGYPAREMSVVHCGAGFTGETPVPPAPRVLSVWAPKQKGGS